MKKTHQSNSNRKKQEKSGRNNDNSIGKIMLLTIAVIVIAFVGLMILSPETQNNQEQAVGPISFVYDKQPALGKPDAQIKIVEFGDFKCPSCKAFTEKMFPLIKKDFIDTGIVSFYFMNDIVVGADSTTAAIAAEAVYRQSNEAFWKYYEALYRDQGVEAEEWATPEFLVDLARKESLAINIDQLNQEIEARTYGKDVEEDSKVAVNAGVTGTPTLFINGRKFENIFNYSELKAAIETEMKGSK